MQSRRSAGKFLAIYFTIVLAGVVFRIDNWPLTWVPMYASYKPVAEASARVWNKEEIRRGFKVTTLDGSTEFVNHERLNIPRTKFVRLYYERMYGDGPIKEVFNQQSMSGMNRYLRELVGEYPAADVSWDWRILYSLNKSLQREPGNPDFIVEVQAPALQRVFLISDLNDGGGVTPVVENRVATAVWDARWLDRWLHDEL